MELGNAWIAFKVLADVNPMLKRLKKIPYYVILDVEHDLKKKARLVVDRH